MIDLHLAAVLAFLGEMAPPLLAGAALGVFYFAGLWLTVDRLPRSGSPRRLVALSFVARLAVLLAGLALITDGDWRRLVAAMAGLVVVRFAAVHLLAPQAAPQGGEA